MLTSVLLAYRRKKRLSQKVKNSSSEQNTHMSKSVVQVCRSTAQLNCAASLRSTSFLRSTRMDPVSVFSISWTVKF